MKRTTGVVLTVFVLGLLVGCSNTGPLDSSGAVDAYITKPLAVNPAPASMSVEYSSVVVKWTRANGGTAFTYYLMLDTQDPPTTVVATATDPDTSAVVPGLLPQTRYYWQVKAVATEGGERTSDEFVFATKLPGLEQYYSAMSVRALAIQGGVVWVGRSGADLFGLQNGASVDTITSAREITSMVVDAANVLWVAGWGGILSHDGSGKDVPLNAQSLLGDSLITSVAADVGGSKLFGTSAKGVRRYNGSRWWKIDSVRAGGARKVLTSGPVQALAIDPAKNGTNSFSGVWVGMSDGLYCLDSLHEFISKIDSVKRWNATAAETLWVRTDTVYDTSYYATGYTTTSGLPGISITALRVSSAGTIWAGTRSNGLAYLNGATWATASGLSVTGTGSITCLTADATGGMWVGTYGGGLVHLAADGSLLTYYNASNSALPSNTVFDVCIEASGKVWVATGEGLIAFQPQ